MHESEGVFLGVILTGNFLGSFLGALLGSLWKMRCYVAKILSRNLIVFTPNSGVYCYFTLVFYPSLNVSASFW